MEDFLQSQIQESCRLALPEGLKDLMSDVSREVLRAQPAHLFQFIANYLSALLVTRENLAIASRVCKDVCDCTCHPELEDELRDTGIFEEDVAAVTKIVLEHFNSGEVNEANLMLKILNRTQFDQDQLPELQVAIQNAFIRHQKNHTTVYESSSESDIDEIDNAVRHTLKLYEMSKPTTEEYEAMAKKIQTSYRAYGVKRYCQLKPHEAQEQSKLFTKNVKLVLPARSGPDMTTIPEKVIESSSCHNKSKLYTVSSTSLAGSYMHLPKYRPYSVHDTEILSDLEETPEKEHAYIDYTAENPHVSISSDSNKPREKQTSFDIMDEVDEEIVDEAIEEHYEVIEEEIIGTAHETSVNIIAIDEDVKNVDEIVSAETKSSEAGVEADVDETQKDQTETVIDSQHKIVEDVFSEYDMTDVIYPERSRQEVIQSDLSRA